MIVIDEEQMTVNEYETIKEYLQDTGVEHMEGALYSIQNYYVVENAVFCRNNSEELIDIYGEKVFDWVHQQVQRGVVYSNEMQHRVEDEVDKALRTFEAFDKYGIEELRQLLQEIESGSVEPYKGPIGSPVYSSEKYDVILDRAGRIEGYYAKSIGDLSSQLVEAELRVR